MINIKSHAGVSVSSTPKDFQIVYDGEIWCLSTVTFVQRVQNWIVARSTAHDSTVCISISTKLTEKNSIWKTKKSHAAKSEFK